MAKKGSIAAVLFVLIVGIVGAVFLYGGGSSETGAMLLENDEGSTTTSTLQGDDCICKATACDAQFAKTGAGKKVLSAAGDKRGCCGVSFVPGECAGHCVQAFSQCTGVTGTCDTDSVCS